MNRPRYARSTILLLALGAAAIALPNMSASAAGCPASVKFTPSSNITHLVGAQKWTLPAIKSACPQVPITQADATKQIWEINTNLVVDPGATLVLHGTAARSPGEVNTLRLMSKASGAAKDVIRLWADGGTLDLDSVAVSSWDPDRSGPDTDTRVPSTVAPRGRAFIQASSFKDGSGVHNATMNIAHSDLGYLGFYASESYGVSYKAQQCTHTNLAACDEEKVLGKEVDSRFHDNYMGTYTWGAYGMAITGNSYDHNTMYGLDMHDVTRNMNIDHNHSSYNGDHGIICSQKCDSLKITNNESDHNGMVKWSGPNPDAESGGQVHGIMLHRGVTNSEITGNKVHDQPNGSGIAIFDSKGVLAKNNILDKNYYGIRLSVGTADGVFSHNTISHSTQYAIFTYTGSDSTENTPTPRPTGNTFSDNTIAGTNSYVVRLNQTDGTQFIDNTVTAPGGAFFTSESTGTVLRHNTFPNSQSVVVLSSSKTAGVMTVDEPTGPLGVQLDADSTCEFTSKSGTLFSAAGKSIRTKAASTGSNLHLTSALLGTNPVAVSPQKVAVLPSAGSLSAFADGLTVTINGQTTSKSVKFTISGLTEGTKYKVNRDGTVVGTYTADSDGRISFSNKPPTSASTKYTVVS